MSKNIGYESFASKWIIPDVIPFIETAKHGEPKQWAIASLETPKGSHSMIRLSIFFAIMLSALACGKASDNKQKPAISSDIRVRDASPLAGTYQQADNGLARLQISPDNLVVGTTITIPSTVVGNETRLSPQFPQSLVYNPATGLYSTIGTFNDADGVFKNVEMRIRLYEQNRFLDVTLITPPDEALTTQAQARTSAQASQANQSGTVCEQNPNQSPNQNPNQNNSNPACPVCPKIPQLMFTFRFIRI